MKKINDMEDKFLCYIRLIGETVNDEYTYEFLFTSTPDVFWGENFEYMPCGLCNELIPDSSTYDEIKIAKTNIKLGLVQNQCCFSFQDAIDGIVAIAWEDISDYETYPDDGRLILNFGDTFEDVEEKLANKKIIFE